MVNPTGNYLDDEKIDELRMALESQRQDYRARYSTYGSRSAVLLAGAGAFVGFIAGLEVSPGSKPNFFLLGALVCALLATIFATISLKPVDGLILRLSDAEYEIRDMTLKRSKEHLYRQELDIAKADEKLLSWRSKWLNRSIYLLVSSTVLLVAKALVPLIVSNLSFA